MLLLAILLSAKPPKDSYNASDWSSILLAERNGQTDKFISITFPPCPQRRRPGAIADGILEPKLTTIQTDSCFQLTRIVKSGDEVVNPVQPTRTNSSRQCNSGKTKCLASSKTIAINHRAVPCDVCKCKTLIKCGDIAPKMYDRMINGTNLQ